MEILVDVAEEGHGVILKVLTGVHEHGVEDKAVEHDDNGDENSHNDRECITQIGVEIVLVNICGVMTLKNW